MAKKKDKDSSEVDIATNDSEIIEDIKEGNSIITNDDNSEEVKSNNNIKLYCLWYKRKKEENWSKVDREFKTEISANNHNIFVTGYKITEVLLKDKNPE